MTDASQSRLTDQTSDSTATTADFLGVLSPKSAEILEARGIDLELAARLGWRSSSMITSGECIEIPYFIGEEHVNSKFRTLEGEKRFVQQKDAVKCFYNQNCIDDWQNSPNSRLIITEGEMDCLIALQCGFFAISVPDGAPSSRVGADSIKYSYLDGFPSNGEIVICSDGDKPGANLLHDLSLRLGKHRCLWVKYPSGCKDLNDVFLLGGRELVIETIASAEWVEVSGVYKMSDLAPLPPQEFHKLQCIPINIRKADFSVVTGIPSHGKTTFVNFIAFDIVKHSNWRIAFASFEQTPQTHHRHNLRTLILGMRPKLAEPDELAHADKWIDDKFRFIVPNIDDEVTLGWLLEKMAVACIRHGVDMFVVDPWNEMEHDRGPMTQTEYTGLAIRQLKKFARKYNVHMMIIAHPSKMKRKDKYNDGIPTLYDIADSAHWSNKPDLGIVVHRPKEGESLIRVQKSRDDYFIGQAGDYTLTYNKELKTFVGADALFSFGGD
jgi:twinkle protein